MKRVLGIALGLLTAIGGFVDIGDIVANSLVGSRYGMALAWAVVVGVIGICVFAEMSGRVAAITHRATFDLVRERLGPGAGLLNLVGSCLVTGLTLAAEIGGVALALELATSVNYLLWAPVVGVLVWIVIWRVRFKILENVFGMLGLAMIVFGVALWKLNPDWGALVDGSLHPAIPGGEGLPTYFYYAIALFGAAMTPYEVFFFSSGAVEEKWTEKDLGQMRTNVFVGFPIGGLLSLLLMAVAAVTFLPVDVQVDHLGQITIPVAMALGKLGVAVAILAFFATTFGAALETGLSTGYSIAQYFGWQWGKYVRPRAAARFHLVVLIAVVLGVGLILTTADPIKVTEYSIVFSAVALPLTYFPILVIANDPDYMGDHVNRWYTNVMGSIYLVIILVASVAAIPLMIVTRAGQ